jgi:hypothetical protein
MPISRFWRFIGTICYVLSGIFVVVLAFQVVRAHFFLDKRQPASEKHLQNIVIMGPGASLIAPTRVKLRDIKDAIHNVPLLFSPVLRISGKRSANADQSVSASPAPIMISVIETQSDTSVLQPSPAVPVAHRTKHTLGRLVLIPISALLLTALIATSFLFSVRLFSASLGQPADAQVNAAQAAQPQLTRPLYERGIIYPQWYNDGYGVNDTTWQQAVVTMKTQTGAQWIEIPVLFTQATSSSTSIQPSASAPSIQSFIEGIERAHNLGYRVFFVPLMQVREPGGWSGSITFKTPTQQQAWFDSYWNTIMPYVTAASSQHVDQMAIGTELQTLQQIAPDELWSQLIERIRGVLKNTLTYDMNWSSLALPVPAWLHNTNLTYIGVSTYIPLLVKSGRVNPQDMPALWRAKIKTQLDALAGQIGKQVLLTEIGYRNSSDALYRTWEANTTARADSQEQAGAFDAALANVFQDTRIAGTFFWGWDDVGRFAISGQPATQVLLKWYTMKQA